MSSHLQNLVKQHYETFHPAKLKGGQTSFQIDLKQNYILLSLDKSYAYNLETSINIGAKKFNCISAIVNMGADDMADDLQTIFKQGAGWAYFDGDFRKHTIPQYDIFCMS